MSILRGRLSSFMLARGAPPRPGAPRTKPRERNPRPRYGRCEDEYVGVEDSALISDSGTPKREAYTK